MHKLAIFVEGQTEQIFMARFVKEVANENQVEIVTYKADGGSRKRPRRLRRLAGSTKDGKLYYVQIVDSAADNRVLSDMRDQYQGLVREGFSLVLGLRDVYPQSRDEIPAVRKGIGRFLPKGQVPAHLILAIMEIEAWFIAEHTHFAKLHPGISIENANKAIGADVQTMDVETIDHPAATLDKVYKTVGRAYRKQRKRVSKIVDALDFDRLYLELADRVSALKLLCQHLDWFLSQTTNGKGTD